MCCQTSDDLFSFFFFGDHPFFLSCRGSSFPSKIKSRTEFERPDFVIKIIEKPINLASCKVAIHCPDFCFSRYGNPNSGGSHGFVRTRSWSVVIISKPVLVFCYRLYTIAANRLSKMSEPLVSEFDTKENLLLKI